MKRQRKWKTGKVDDRGIICNSFKWFFFVLVVVVVVELC